MSKKLSIIVPVWNNYKYTKRCIEDLAELPAEDVQIIVVDNGSTDETSKLKSFENLKIIRNRENLGFGAACNQGYAISNTNKIMFLNNDIEVRADKNNWINPIIDACDEDVLVGPTIGVLRSDLSFLKEDTKMPRGGLVYMSGWNITANRATWDKLILDGEMGPFSTEMGKAYFEDTDLGFRAIELGIQFKIVSCPVKHLGRKTSQLINTTELYLAAKAKFISKWKERAKGLKRENA